ncbi:MAG TPA: oxalyl-CoA decarboxylase [Dehalococcoidia bacterium]|nr:oxalyl-CoA decarboxylase [Dehalococcoidia bacterium]
MAEIDGATLIARELKKQGVQYMFGIVGIPVVPIAFAAQREGIKFFGMRNEQAASYAAQAASYLIGRPQACLVVSGPGMIHAIAGLANAWSNCWPMILLGGANDSFQDGMGAFQETDQVQSARPFCKYAHRVETTARIPYYVEQAVRNSIYGRPGPVYLDLPGDTITGKVEEESIEQKPAVPEPPRIQAEQAAIEQALEILKSAERPLVVIGKGMAWSRAEAEVKEFIEKTQLPFLPAPMAKGLLPDDHPLSVASARTYALQNTDVALLMGARLNWIMHFGLPPRWSPDVKIIQLDVAAEEIGTNVPAAVGLVGDGKAITAQLNKALEAQPWQFGAENLWRSGLQNKAETNKRNTEPMLASDDVPMGYYRVLREIRDALPRDAIISSEGASTMDIGRQVLNNYEPRTRLDAGSYGTMGVGLAFAIAAAVVHPDKRVVNVEGDSAFGFSGMEVETACRYNLPITFCIINNNGVGGGPPETDHNPLTARPGAYTATARYDKMAEAFGGLGFLCERPEEIRPALDKAFASGKTAVINIMIDPRAQRRPQEFAWLTH